MESITDGRERHWFYIDNAVIDDHTPAIGALGLAVYTTLVRHANGGGQAYPSLRRLGELLGLSRPTVIKYLALLEKEGLIASQHRTSEDGDPTSNLYTLLPVGGGKADLLGSQPPLPPSKGDLLGVVNDVYQGGKGGLHKGLKISKDSRDLKDPESPIIPLTGTKASVDAVLEHLNLTTGKHFREPGEIPGCLSRGYSVPECLVVIDWWQGIKTVEDPEQLKYFDQDTPFRKSKFAKYLAAAEVWDRDGRPIPLMHRLGEKEARSARASLRILENPSHARPRHAGVPRLAR